MNILTELKERFRASLCSLLNDALDADQIENLLGMIRPAQNAEFGDYQANVAMPLGKQLGKPPREIAAQIVAGLDVAGICEPPEIAGPGFINLRLTTDWLVQSIENARQDDRLGCSVVEKPLKYIIDFSSPNVAKPLHAGHVRSTVIGDALCRIIRFRGHEVISDNHIGDWGSQFGMIIYGYVHFVDAQAYAENPIEELGRLYKLVRKLIDYHAGKQQLPTRQKALTEQADRLKQLESVPPEEDPKAEKRRTRALRQAKNDLVAEEKSVAKLAAEIAAVQADSELAPLLEEHADVAESVLEETAKLHEDDPYNIALWKEFMPKCLESIHAIYDRLDVHFDEELGESFYHHRLGSVVESLLDLGLARESQGAICVFLDEFEAPFIIRKKDGAFLYSTSDLATIAYREERWQPDVVLYVVDFRQTEHFEKLFATSRKWLEATGKDSSTRQLLHIKFGTVLGEDKRPFKTRSGDTVGLAGLLNEAEARAWDVVSKNDDAKPDGWELDEPARRHIARVVGIAALKYADLSQNRESDYVFSYEKMLALQGNTATYMQYSYARVCGIFSRGAVDLAALRATSAPISLNHPAERALGLRLLQFGDAIEEVLVDYRPNHLTGYLYDLARTFSTFFEQCHVLKAESEPLRTNRLLLCDLTARTLKLGLGLLGIDVIEKM